MVDVGETTSRGGLRRQHAGTTKQAEINIYIKKGYFFEGFEQFGPLLFDILSGLLLQLPQQCCD